MTDTPEDLPPVKREEPRGERRQERRDERRAPSAAKRVFTELLTYSALILAGALLALVSSYLMRKFGF